MEPDMTTPPTPTFGQTLAYAERTLTTSLRRHLAERGTTPETWYALQLIATRGPRLDRQTLSGELEGSRTLTRDSVRELLARLEAEGLIHGDSALDLTAEGQALHRSLREYIDGLTQRFLGQFPADDIETTMRTLQAITKQATEELIDAG
jgi:DNA-binding MarR family transcriptional regulator